MPFRAAIRVSSIVLTAATLAAALSGCGINGTGSSAANSVLNLTPAVKSGTHISGLVHGGQQAVTGAVVTLWSAGTTGYGKGATALATTVSDASGNFNLDPATVTNITGYTLAAGVGTFTTSSAGTYTTGTTVILGGFPTSTFLNGQEVTVTATTPTSFTATTTVSNTAIATESGTATYYLSSTSPCTPGQYNYITAVGGNPGVGGTYGTVNQAGLALLTAIPTPCSSASGASYVFMNEVTTAAAVTELQQFMTINTSGVEPTMTSQATPPWTIGAPTSNATGLANAFAATTNLVSVSSGSTAPSITSPFTVASTVGGAAYTMQIQPDVLKINTFADVLSACFNLGSAVCSSLITDTTPNGTASPIDTIQIAYEMATNPAGLTMNSYTAANSPYWLCMHYVTPTAPFGPSETCSATTPTFSDWTLGAKWTLYNAGGTKLAITPTSIAIDGGGHVWVGSGSGYTTPSPISEFNVSGQYLLSGPSSVNIPATTLNYYQAGTDYPLSFAGQTGVALTYGRQGGLAIDTLGDVFFVQNSPAISPASITVTTPGALTFLTGMLVEVPAATITAGTSGSGVGILSSFSQSIAITGNNDLIVSSEPVSSRYYSSAFTAASGYTTMNEGGGRITSVYQGTIADQNGLGIGLSANLTACTSTGAGGVIPRSTVANDATLAVTPSTAAPTILLTNQCANYGAIDASNNLWVTGVAGATGTTPAQLTYVDLQTGANTPLQTSITNPTGGLSAPAGVSVDGAGNIWVTNGTSGSSGLSEFTSSVVTVGSGADTLNATPGTTVLSPAVNGGFDVNFGFGTLKGSSIDGSGNLWLQVSGSTIGVIFGAAVPVQTPIATQLSKTAGTTGSVGTRP